MKMSKRFAAGILTAAMSVSFLAMPMTAFAYDVTITDEITTHVQHTYSAYQIFKGVLVEDPTSTTTPKKKILTEIDWGNNINSAGLLAALAANDTFKNDCTDLDTTVAFLKTLDHDSVEMQEFADLVQANITGPAEKTGSDSISGLEGGYYLIDDAAEDIADSQDAISRYILGVFEDTTITLKKDVPEITKTIDEDPTDATPGVEANTASIGDKIPYALTSRVPDMTGYNKYFFVISDKMSDGLTFNNDVAITIGQGEDAVTLAADDYTVEFDNETNSFEIVLKDFISYADKKDAPIYVTYSATLDDDAVIGGLGNPNTVDLTFSNDPNHNYTGETPNPDNPDEPYNPDKPGDGDVTGKTPPSTVTTHTAELDILKIDAKDPNKKLAGAVFQIEGEGVKMVLASGQYFKVAAEGDAGDKYYLLKDGTYTTDTPEESTEDQYLDTETTYVKVDEDSFTYEDATEDALQTATTGTDGLAKFRGLNAGTYTITELKAPAGYNKINEPIEVTIEASNPSVLNGCTWTFSGVEGVKEDATFTFEVENNKGITLPGTGGIGTVMFYVVGTLMMTGSAALLVSNNKKKAEEK